MATSIATPFDSLLEKLIGSQTNTNVDEQLGVKNLISQLLSGQQQTSGQTTNKSTTTADLQRLGDVYNRQANGITPDMLKAIFTEGAKAVPQLVSSTANAVGARSAGNSPLATSLTELNTNLTGQAAKLNNDMLTQAGNTAAQIAAMTKQVTDQQSTNNTVNNTQNTTTNQDQTSTRASDTVQRSTINAKSSAITAGLAGLASLLQGSGIKLSDVTGILGKMFGSGSGGLTIDGAVNAGFGDGTGLGGDWSTPTIDSGGTSDVGTGLGEIWGWADGGIVPTPNLKLGDSAKKAPGQR